MLSACCIQAGMKPDRETPHPLATNQKRHRAQDHTSRDLNLTFVHMLNRKPRSGRRCLHFKRSDIVLLLPHLAAGWPRRPRKCCWCSRTEPFSLVRLHLLPLLLLVFDFHAYLCLADIRPLEGNSCPAAESSAPSESATTGSLVATWCLARGEAGGAVRSVREWTYSGLRALAGKGVNT